MYAELHPDGVLNLLDQGLGGPPMVDELAPYVYLRLRGTGGALTAPDLECGEMIAAWARNEMNFLDIRD